MSFFRRRTDGHLVSDGNSYPEISNDQNHLLEDADDDAGGQPSFPRRCGSSCCGFLRSHKRFLLFLFVLTLIIIGNGVAIYFVHFSLTYFRCNPKTCHPIKVMSLNTWGMPSALGSEYKQQRMEAIAAEVNKAAYDLYLLEELWMEPDYWTVRAGVPKGYYMTEYRGLALSTCDGRVLPTACSGLAIISKFPFVEVEFNSYTEHGNFWKAGIDGEWFARKGVGRVRIHPIVNVTMDVFVTHTCADPDPRLHNYTNEWYRDAQVKELMDTYVKKSTADIVLLGGDFNAGPDLNNGAPYETVRQHMSNSIEDFFYKVNTWLDAKYATYGNIKNTFSGYVFDPIIYDYIFYRTNTEKAYLNTNWFELPFFKLKLSLFNATEELEDNVTYAMLNVTSPDDNVTLKTALLANATSRKGDALPRAKRDVSSVTTDKMISFSDHEAVTSTIYLRF